MLCFVGIDVEDQCIKRLRGAGPQHQFEDLWHGELQRMLEPDLRDGFSRVVDQLQTTDTGGLLDDYLALAETLNHGLVEPPVIPDDLSALSPLRLENLARRCIVAGRQHEADQLLTKAYRVTTPTGRSRILHVHWGHGSFDLFDDALDAHLDGHVGFDDSGFATLLNLVSLAVWIRTPERLNKWGQAAKQAPEPLHPKIEQALADASIIVEMSVEDTKEWSSWTAAAKELDKEAEFNRFRALVLAGSEQAVDSIAKAADLCRRSYQPGLAQNHNYWTLKSSLRFPTNEGIQNERAGAVCRVNTLEARAICAVYAVRGVQTLSPKLRHTILVKSLSETTPSKREERSIHFLDSAASELPRKSLLTASAFLTNSLYRRRFDDTIEPRTAVVISGQGRGFERSFPTQIAEVVGPASADVFITTWSDVGIPRGAHAGRLARMIPPEIGVIPDGISDAEFQRHFPNTYATLQPPSYDIEGVYRDLWRRHAPENCTLRRIDVENDSDAVALHQERGIWPADKQLQNQVRMIYKMARGRFLLEDEEVRSGAYQRVVWMRPDCPVEQLEIPDLTTLRNFAFSSFVLGPAFGDYAMILDRRGFNAIGSVYDSLLSEDWDLWQRHDGIGPHLFGDLLMWHGYGLSAFGWRGRVGQLMSWQPSASIFAASFIDEFDRLSDSAMASQLSRLRERSMQVLA